MKKILSLAVVLLGCASTVFGRIGETETQMENRYGGSRSGYMYGEIPRGAVIREYHKDGFTILVAFYKGHSQREEYRKVGASFSDSEITTILQINSPGSNWVEKSDSDHFTVWQTKDGSLVGLYQKPTDSDTIKPMVQVETLAFRDAAKADAGNSFKNGASGL